MTLINFRQMPYRGSRLSTMMDELFENSIQKGFRTWSAPAANILESGERYEVQLAAPGMLKDDFKINIEDDKLIVSKTGKKQEAVTGFIHKEFEFDAFSRTFSLPGDVAQDQIAASYENGILKIVMPKSVERSKVKEVKVA